MTTEQIKHLKDQSNAARRFAAMTSVPQVPRVVITCDELEYLLRKAECESEAARMEARSNAMDFIQSGR